MTEIASNPPAFRLAIREKKGLVQGRQNGEAQKLLRFPNPERRGLVPEPIDYHLALWIVAYSLRVETIGLLER